MDVNPKHEISWSVGVFFTQHNHSLYNHWSTFLSTYKFHQYIIYTAYLRQSFYQYSVYVLDLIAYCISISPTRPILLFSKIAMISSIFIIRYMQLLGNFQIIRKEFFIWLQFKYFSAYFQLFTDLGLISYSILVLSMATYSN